MTTTENDGAELRLVSTVDTKLPEFEGRIPIGVLTSLTGSGQRIGRAIHHGDRLVLVVEATVASIDHPMTKDGLKRRQTLHVEDLYEVEGVFGRRLLASCRQAWSEVDTAGTVLGQVPLPDPEEGPGFPTDGSGVALTPAELADIGLGDAELDPVVVVWSDGTREAWPDDFAEELKTTRPRAGMYAEVWPEGGPVPAYIAEVIDAHTAETLDTWTAEQEDDRLKTMEQEAAALEEAAMPYPGFGDMSATAALKAVSSLGDVEVLEAMRTYEAAHKNRKSVLGRIAKRIEEVGA